MTKRRNFLIKSSLLTAGIFTGILSRRATTIATDNSDDLYQIGPMNGYNQESGRYWSTMTMMRTWIVRGVENLTVEELDYQIDDQSNSIGAMLLHLAATEKYYQLNTFDEMAWGSWSEEIKKEWDLPMNLGEDGRKQIVGHDINYYLSKLEEVRKVTEKEFAKRDDTWLMKSESFFDNLPTNNHAKWFHVCEHESNHNGQIKFIKKTDAKVKL
jgi:uncharacterized damage-inducible protein DinB